VERQLDQTLSLIDGFMTAQMVLGRGPDEALARWTEVIGDSFEDELAAYHQRKPGLPERLYFTEDFVGSGAKATEWVRGVARAVLFESEFMNRLTAREDELPHLFRGIFLGLTLDQRSEADRGMEPEQRVVLEHFRAQAQLFRAELGRVGTRKRMNMLANVLGVLDVVQSGKPLQKPEA